VTDPHAAIAAVFRIEFPRLVGALARLTRDVGRTEELAQDALVVALERWPTDGVPDPVLPTEARVALTLRLVSGLASSEIARAFLSPSRRRRSRSRACSAGSTSTIAGRRDAS